jgi:hypothetical protein
VRVLAGSTLALIAACASAPSSPSVAPTSGGSGQPTLAYALLSNGHLLAASIDDGKALQDLELASSSPQVQAQLHAMVLSVDGATVYVLVEDAARAPRIAVVDTATRRVVRTLEVGSGSAYRGLDLGRRSGSLYVFGNDGGAAVVWIVDPTGRNSTRRLLARPAEGRSWFVYQGLVSADETALFISYHGPDTTGIDRFDLRDGVLVRCSQGPFPESGCFRAHGGMRLVRDRLLATTGEGPLLALDPATGVKHEQYDVALEGNHVMEFAVDEDAQRLFVVGSCGYSRGLATVDIRRGVTQVLAPSRAGSSPCGERIAVAPEGRRLVVVQTALPVPSSSRPGTLLVLSSAGAELRQIPTAAEAIDLLLVPIG